MALRDLPVVLRTDEYGSAKYTELHLHPLVFLGQGPHARTVVVEAAGFRTESVQVSVDGDEQSLLVHLRRSE